MKKLLLIPIALFTIGCVNNPNVDTKIDKTTRDMKLLNDYHTTIENLHKLGDDYIFLNLATDGSLSFNKIDKNYDPIMSKKIDLVITPSKVKVQNDKIYILGYSQTQNKPIFVILDKNGNITKKFLVGKKFNTPIDFLVQNENIIIGLNSYSKKNLTDVVIYKNNHKHLFSSKYAEELTTIIPYNDGYLLIGNVTQDSQNVFISYIDKNFKSIWTRDIDFGLEESLKDVEIKKNTIILHIISQNYTGMEEYYTVKIDKNGKILNQSKEFEIKNYPLKFQG